MPENQTAPADVAASSFNCLARDDVPTAMAQLSPQGVWHQPGANRFSGDHVGIDGVGALLGGMMETSEGSFQLPGTGAAMMNGEFVTVPVRFTGARSDVSMDMAGVDMLTVRDGKIIAVHLSSEDGVTEDAFWVRG